MEGEIKVTADPVIVKDGKLFLVNYGSYSRLPGGFVEGDETLEDACLKRVKENTGKDIEIVKPLSPGIVWKKVEGRTKAIVSINYLARFR